MTFQVLPSLSIYRSTMDLGTWFLPIWYMESESTFYATGLRYQNFPVSGYLGELPLTGRMNFHAEEVRYRRAQAKLSFPLASGTLKFSANQWTSAAEYTSNHKKTYGAWPCVNVGPWDEAWCHVGRTDAYRFEVYISAASVPNLERLSARVFGRAGLRRRRSFACMVKSKIGAIPRAAAIRSPRSLSTAFMIFPLWFVAGFPRTFCPPNLIRCFEAKNYGDKKVYDKGQIVSYASEGWGANRLLRIGGGRMVHNHLELYYAPALPD